MSPSEDCIDSIYRVTIVDIHVTMKIHYHHNIVPDIGGGDKHLKGKYLNEVNK